MKTFTATELKNRTGEFVESALKEPVEIQKSGRSILVAMSKAEYEALQAYASAYWAERAKQAEAGGWATDAEVTKLLESAKGA